ncbi:hypothetical protein D3C86_1105270 [compost metagenome]
MPLAAGHDLGHAGFLGRLAVLDLDQAHAVEVLHQGGGEVLGLGHGPARRLPRLLAEAAHDQADGRHAQQHDQGQTPVDKGHRRDDGDQGQGVLGVVNDARGEGLAHQIGVEQHRRDKGARVLAAQPRQVGADHGREQAHLNIADNAVAQPVDEGRLTQRRQRPSEGHAQNSQGNGQQRPLGRDVEQTPQADRRALLHEQAVDRRLEQFQQHRRQAAGQGGAQHGDKQGGLVPREIVAPDPAQQGAKRFGHVVSGRGHRLSVERLGRQVKPRGEACR